MGEYIGIDVGKATLDVCFSDKVTTKGESTHLNPRYWTANRPDDINFIT
ncbi:hypothetical protein [Candidatus Regiella endosymbiont of Tuberolachnus salignus]